jgi:uncharacterized protein (TIRG00374 family)
VGLLVYLLSRVEFSEVISALATADPLWLVLALAMLAIGKIIIGTRWRLLIEAQGLRIPLISLISSILTGIFFGSLLPTKIGGDAVRAYDVADKGNASITEGVGSVVIDRALGILGLALFSSFTLLIARGTIELSGGYVGLVVVVLFIAIIAFGMLIYAPIADLVSQKLARHGLESFSSMIIELRKALNSMTESRKAISLGLLLSLILQVFIVIHYALLGESLGLAIPLSFYFVAVPIALLILILPASINGIGVREVIFVYLLGQVSVAPADAIALSWLAFSMLLLQAVIGGVLFALRGRANTQQTDTLAAEPRS